MNPFPFMPIVIVIISLSFLSWGFYRARRLGNLGLLAWCQQVALVAPWIVYFGLFLSGIFLNIVLLIFLLVASTVAYAVLGDRLRRALQVEKSAAAQQLATLNLSAATVVSEKDETRSSPNDLQKDIKSIQGIFGIETFYVTESQIQPEGVTFKGNLRGDAAAVHQRLSEDLRDRFGGKYNLYLLEGQEKRPMVVVIPNSPVERATIPQIVLAVVLVLVSAYTSLFLGGSIENIDLSQHPEQAIAALPFAFGIFAILGCRELAQRGMAQRYRVSVSPAFLLPSTELGAFGAFSRLRSPLPHRKSLFDIAIAPAVSSGMLSLGMLLVGLGLSAAHHGTLEVPSQIFQASVLVGGLSRVILGEELHIDFVTVHPLVVLGWIGLVITALHLMPAGQLDGGRIVQAIYGRRTANWMTLLTLIFLALATFINPVALYWGGIILLLLREQERPMLNEISELDGDREALGVLALFWMLVTLLPMTPAVAERLGIGG